MSKSEIPAGLIAQRAWAIEAGTYRRLMEWYAHGNSGTETVPEAGRKRKRSAPMSSYGAVAVVPIRGVISPDADDDDGEVYGMRGTSVDRIRRDLEAALANPQAKSILLDVDSPGGSVAGIDELASDIRFAREKKPIFAFTDGMMASAAYWLASQADRIYATRTAAVGSIGVITAIGDFSRLLKNIGVEVHYVTSAPGKAAGAPGQHFETRDREIVQGEVNAYHDLFVDAVAQGRRMPLAAAAVLGDGMLSVGAAARTKNLIDEVATRASVLKRIDAGTPAPTMPTDATQRVAPTATAGTTSEVSVMTIAELTPPAPEPKPVASPPAPPAQVVPPADLILGERRRVQAIRALAKTGNDKLVDEMIGDGTSAEDAARRLLAAAQAADQARLDALRLERATALAVPEPTPTPLPSGAAPGDKLSEEAGAIWAKNARVRETFRGDREAFVHYRQGVAAGAYRDTMEY